MQNVILSISSALIVTSLVSTAIVPKYQIFFFYSKWEILTPASE